MKTKILLPIVIVGLLGAAGFYLLTSNSEPVPSSAAGPQNATYTVDGVPVTLLDGKAETEAAPGSASKVTTTIFGEPTVGDLNNDGVADSAVMLAQNTGGSGTFYYVAAALQTTEGVKGTNAILLGDRIAPQTLEINGSTIIANYAERNPGEPMTTPPSKGVSKYLKVTGMKLEEITDRPTSGTPPLPTDSSPEAITLENNTQTLYYDLGSRFTLKLGDSEWAIAISDPTIIRRVKNIAMVKGAQGIYTADKAGKTVITADGKAPCESGSACSNAIIHFKVTIVVLGKTTAVPAGTGGSSGVCTEDAKMCPDGSYVGRIPPKCDFAACPAPKGSGIQGNVLLGPTCPVETSPPDPKCAPKPYAAALGIYTVGGTKVIKSVVADSSGHFSVAVSAGSYEIRSAPEAEALPNCRSNEVIVVKPNAYTEVSISCDSGIR